MFDEDMSDDVELPSFNVGLDFFVAVVTKKGPHFLACLVQKSCDSFVFFSTSTSFQLSLNSL